MNTLFVGKNLLELSEVDSTNAFANQLLSSQPAEGTVVRAAYQSAGRGQQSNVWLSQANANLTFSLILHPKFLAPQRAFALNKVVSLALHQCIQELLPDRTVSVKWPNDILVDGKKVAGILIENHLDQHGIKASIVGIGLNVNQVNFPDELSGKASSLSLEAGRQFDLDAVFTSLLEHLESLYLQLLSGKTERLDFGYLQALYGYGEQIRVRFPDPKVLAKIEAGGTSDFDPNPDAGLAPKPDTGPDTNPDAGLAPAPDPKEKEVVLVGVTPEGLLALQLEDRLHYFYHKQLEFIL